MNYESSKKLSDLRFKRLVGVERRTFDKMLEILTVAYQAKHSKGGRTPKMSLEDILIATLQYLREYRTYEQIAADFGVHESNLIRHSHWVEEALVQSGFTIEKGKVKDTDTIIVDASEVKIQRPKKQKLNYSGKKKLHVGKVQVIITGQGKILFIDVQLDYCHDMKLFRKSRRDLSKAREILADSGYQGLMKLYPQAKTPIKSSRYHPLTKGDKSYNRDLSSRRIKVENIFAKFKVFNIFSTTYRNRKKRFGLRMNLIAGIINFERL
ncbi:MULTISPECIES: IS5 family transposase [unclassified Streptococcus]|uniref:IS5 family transposase n=1 Tax=unclassified Streptococcus TaxID=2608887 RepID=UPI0010726FBD|nr:MULTISPECIES: IS5 family transposase [unclassified Streptococcus]MBF0806190.1 IS5 family transposase [Streptococcus sp. 19428wA2_WM07]TFU28213.1 IS5 family transposase [Streptococcus sp. WM07]